MALSNRASEISTIVGLVRSGIETRPEIARESGLGRNVVSERIQAGMRLGLLEVAGAAPSTGGRAPERWRLRAEQGTVLAGDIGASSMWLGLCALDGRIMASKHVDWPIGRGPEPTLAHIESGFRELLTEHDPTRLWGIGIGLPGPIKHSSGRPVNPPIMPNWDGFDVRGWLSGRFKVGTWVDNDVNLMALGTTAPGRTAQDLIYVKLGTGIGAGILCGGKLHRGSQGCAGDIGHAYAGAQYGDVVCRCGRVGCLEAVAGGWAMERDALKPLNLSRSEYLRSVLAERGRILAADVGRGAALADPVCMELITSSLAMVGEVLSTLVSFFNPSEIVFGGGVLDAGAHLISHAERIIRARTLRLATQDLVIRAGRSDRMEGVVGGARMVLDALFSPDLLNAWAGYGTPHGCPAVIDSLA